MGDERALRPFTIAVPDAALDDLADRLARTRLTRELPIEAGTPADTHGVTRRRVEALVARWRDGYDWRAWEARLDRAPPADDPHRRPRRAPAARALGRSRPPSRSSSRTAGRCRSPSGST